MNTNLPVRTVRPNLQTQFSVPKWWILHAAIMFVYFTPSQFINFKLSYPKKILHGDFASTRHQKRLLGAHGLLNEPFCTTWEPDRTSAHAVAPRPCTIEFVLLIFSLLTKRCAYTYIRTRYLLSSLVRLGDPGGAKLFLVYFIIFGNCSNLSTLQGFE